MTGSFRGARRHWWTGSRMICLALFLAACSLTTGKGATVITRPVADREIEDLRRIPQKLTPLTNVAGSRTDIGDTCRGQLLEEFKRRYFAPWTASAPLFDNTESLENMQKEGKSGWYGVNKRKVAPKQMQELLDNCALDRFPSRNDTAIAVAPGHLRGLPTYLPLYSSADSAPFDMLSYPQVKLNEPLRVLHVSRDGVWLFVETGYSNGWIEARDVALVERPLIESWMRGPHLVIVRDFVPIREGDGLATFRSKLGTILPLVREQQGWWDVTVASAGDGGRAETASSRVPRDAAAPFPLRFENEHIAQVGDQLLGQPYGWGELYDLRDCSALLRDFFLPFGIWMPRTSADQIASVKQRHDLAVLTPPEKLELIRSKGVPFLTLLYKPGHIMLYAGTDAQGRPLIFHDAWSIKVKDGAGERTQIIGSSAITTLEPGKELGLVPGSSLLDHLTEMAIITERCR
jgi:hypothetical protein